MHFGGVATLGSGLPYNYTTGASNSGEPEPPPTGR